jgi:hypothetical protein
MVQNIKDKKVHLHNTNISRNKRLRPTGINSNDDLYTDVDENTVHVKTGSFICNSAIGFDAPWSSYTVNLLFMKNNSPSKLGF